jgi:hypothetical protein
MRQPDCLQTRNASIIGGFAGEGSCGRGQWVRNRRADEVFVFAVVERTTEHLPTIFAATMNERRLAGLTDNARAMTAAFRAVVSWWRRALHERQRLQDLFPL